MTGWVGPTRRTFVTGALLTASALAMSARDPAEAEPGRQDSSDGSRPEWVRMGELRHVYDPSQPGGPAKYLNDHTIVLGSDGRWHLYSIIGDKAPPGEWPDYTKEIHFAHASASSPEGPWSTHPYAMTVDPDYYGEEHLWAPYVIENAGVYYMFYAAGGGPPGATASAINLAVSTDMFGWTRLPSGPLFRDYLSARDPYVVRVGSMWVLYYTATETVNGGHHVVAYRTSSDLVNWSGRQVAYRDTETVDSSPNSNTESPFVLNKGGWWYLFIGPRGGYIGTDVYRSRDPLNFAERDFAGHLPMHAAEVVTAGTAQWVTGAGWTENGLYIGDLLWSGSPND